MNCIICNNEVGDSVFRYDKPDKYEEWMGIIDVLRGWYKCDCCGFYQSWRDYPLADLQKIYTEGYRDPKFRGETIRETYEKIMNLPLENSENAERFKWFIHHITQKTGCNVLDIGSGLGVWPDVLDKAGYNVWCMENNKESIDFIRNELKIKCVDELPTYAKFDIITCLHVLEHIEDPKSFLASIKVMMKNGGELFIEVPDAVEFRYLEKDNNEFSSDHVWFFDLSTLNRLAESCGFEIIHAYRSYYKERQLSRVLTILKQKRR